MAELGLQLAQKAPGERVREVHREHASGEINLDQWQDYFSKQFSKFLTRVGKIRNYEVQAGFCKTLVPIQQKGRRVPITLQEKLDRKKRQTITTGAYRKTC